MVLKLPACLLSLILALPAAAPDPPDASMVWFADFDAAFTEAVDRDTIVFLAVNMDGERANDTAAKKLYKDKAILTLSIGTVNLVASRYQHSNSGPCPRFGSITCAQHQQIDIKARARILNPGPSGEVIAPHHVFLDKDGKILLSVPYQVSAKELAWCFTAALRKAYPERKITEVRRARAPRRLIMDGVIDSGSAGIRPLSDEELEVTLKRIRSAGRFEDRANDIFSLIATDHPDAVEAVARDLQTINLASAFGGRRGGQEEGQAGRGAERMLEARINLIHSIGVYAPTSYWEAITTLLQDPEVKIRQEAAVALEQLAAEKSVKAVKAALKNEEDLGVRRCLVRALGTSGVDSSVARKSLSSLAKAKKEPQLRLNALFCLGGQVEQKSVFKTLEAVLADGSADQRQAVLLGIAFARNASLEPLIADLEASADNLDSETIACLEAVRLVLDGANLSAIADRVRTLLGDEIPRERFFGVSS